MGIRKIHSVDEQLDMIMVSETEDPMIEIDLGDIATSTGPREDDNGR